MRVPPAARTASMSVFGLDAGASSDPSVGIPEADGVGVGGDARRRRRARLRLGALRDVVGGERGGRPGGRLTLRAGADGHRVKRVWRGRGGGVPHPRRRPSTTAAVRCRSMLVLGGQESQTVGPT